MAALQKIRGMSGLLIGVLGLALLAFILSDFLTSGSPILNRMKDNAFSVDGDVVSTGSYAERVEQWETLQKVFSNRNSLDEAALANVRDAVYQQMVNEKMLDEQAEALGLAVTPEELTDMVYGNNISPILHEIPLFRNQETGMFDQVAFAEFMKQINQDVSTLPVEHRAELLTYQNIWNAIETRIKYYRLEEKYTALVSGAMLVNDVEVKASMADTKNTADIAYVMNPYTSISDSTITISDDELKAKYDQQKRNYKIDSELRKLSYFIKDVIPSEEDYAEVKTEMDGGLARLRETSNPEEVVNEFSGNKYINAYLAVSNLPIEAKTFAESANVGDVYGPERNGEAYIMYKLIDKAVGPDSVKLQIIALPQGVDLKLAENLADSLHTVIKGGKSFTDVANEFMPGSNGGEYPMVDEMSLVAGGFPRTIIDAPVGDVSKVSLGGQTALVRVSAKSKPVSKVKLAIVQMPVIVSDKTQSIADNELNQFMNQSANMKDFKSAAQQAGYSLMQNVLFPPSARGIDNVSGSRSVIQWAFNEKVGAVKKFDFSDKRIIALIEGQIEGEYQPLAEVKDFLRLELIKDKKAEKMISDLKTKNLTSLDAYAQSLGQKVDTAKFVTFETARISNTNVGSEPLFNVYSKVGQVNKVEGPLKGNMGVYVIDVLNRNETPTNMTPEQVKQRLTQQRMYQSGSAMMALMEKSEIKDNRVKFW